MSTVNGQKLAGAAGIVFIVMTLVSGFVVTPPPTPNESATKFFEYYTDNRNALLAQGIIALLANVPAFLFLAGLWNILRSEEGEGGIFAPAAIFAFIAVGAVASVTSALSMAVAMSADGNGLTEETVKSLSFFTIMANLAIFSCMAGAAAFSAFLISRSSRLPNWIGWIGLVAGLALLASTASVATSGAFQPFGILTFAGFLLLSIYVLALGVFMWLRAGK